MHVPGHLRLAAVERVDVSESEQAVLSGSESAVVWLDPAVVCMCMCVCMHKPERACVCMSTHILTHTHTCHMAFN